MCQTLRAFHEAVPCCSCVFPSGPKRWTWKCCVTCIWRLIYKVKKKMKKKGNATRRSLMPQYTLFCMETHSQQNNIQPGLQLVPRAVKVWLSVTSVAIPISGYSDADLQFTDDNLQTHTEGLTCAGHSCPSSLRSPPKCHHDGCTRQHHRIQTNINKVHD